MNVSSSESSLEHRSFKSVINLYETEQESCIESVTSGIVSGGHETFGDRNFEVGVNDTCLDSIMRSISGGVDDTQPVNALSGLTNEDNNTVREPTKYAPIHVPNPPYTFAGRFHSSSRLSKPCALPTLEINLPRYSPTPLRPVSPIPQEIREKLLPICVLDRIHPTELNQLDETVSNKFGDVFSSRETQVTKATVHELTATNTANTTSATNDDTVNPTTTKTTRTTTSDPVSCNLQAVDSGISNTSPETHSLSEAGLMERSTRESFAKKSIRWVPELDMPVSELRHISCTNQFSWMNKEYKLTDRHERFHPSRMGRFASVTTNPNWSSGSSSSLEVLDIQPPFESESESTDSSTSRKELAYGVVFDSWSGRLKDSSNVSKSGIIKRHSIGLVGGRDPRREIVVRILIVLYGCLLITVGLVLYDLAGNGQMNPNNLQRWFAIFVCIGEILLIMANRATGRRWPYRSKKRPGPRGKQAVRMTHFCHETTVPHATRMEFCSCSVNARFVDKLRDVKRFCSGIMRFDRETTVRLPATICERREDVPTDSNSFNGQNHPVLNEAPSLLYVETQLFRLIFAGLSIVSTAYFAAQICLCKTTALVNNSSVRSMVKDMNHTGTNQYNRDPICETHNALAICLVIVQTWLILCTPQKLLHHFDGFGLWLSTHLFSTNLIMLYINHEYLPFVRRVEGMTTIEQTAAIVGGRLLPFVGQYHLLASLTQSFYCISYIRPRGVVQHLCVTPTNGVPERLTSSIEEPNHVSVDASFGKQCISLSQYHFFKWRLPGTHCMLLLIPSVSFLIVVSSHFVISDSVVKLLTHYLIIFALTAASISISLYFLYGHIRQYSGQTRITHLFPLLLCSRDLTLIIIIFVIYTCFVHLRQIGCIVHTTANIGASRWSFAFLLFTHSTLVVDVLCQLVLVLVAPIFSCRMHDKRNSRVPTIAILIGLISFSLLFCYATVPADEQFPCGSISPCFVFMKNQTRVDSTIPINCRTSMFPLCSIPYVLRILFLVICICKL